MRALDSEDCVKVEEGELEKKKKPFDKWLLEEVAEKTPERIKKIPVDINTGCTEAIASEVAEFLEFKGELKAKCADQVCM